MPAEFERHAATWVAWPHNTETWPGCLDRAEAEFQTLVQVIARSEPVHVLARDRAQLRELRQRLGGTEEARRIQLHEVPTDDCWMRDTGPTFVTEGSTGLVALDWTFNSWGGKYPPWERDDAVAARVAALAGVECVRSELVVEGGALEVDGDGTLLATESSLLDPRRNPDLDREELEARLRELLGIERIIWLRAELAGDDTDAHVDNLARFSRPGCVVCAHDGDPLDPNAESLRDCRRRLREARDARGRGLELIDLPMPPPLEADGGRLPASYANFYIANRVVVVPAFGVPTDAPALERLAPLFPGRSVVGVPCRTLLRGLGAVHCLTQQQPALAAPAAG